MGIAARTTMPMASPDEASRMRQQRRRAEQMRRRMAEEARRNDPVEQLFDIIPAGTRPGRLYSGDGSDLRNYTLR